MHHTRHVAGLRGHEQLPGPGERWQRLHRPPLRRQPGAVAWLLVSKSKDGDQNGPTGGDTLANTTFVQRLNTAGGLAPATGCNLPTDIGNQKFVPYTADYFFYKKAR